MGTIRANILNNRIEAIVLSFILLLFPQIRYLYKIVQFIQMKNKYHLSDISSLSSIDI